MAVAVSNIGILAAGTSNRIISLFSPTYECISTFQTSRGAGITQIIWSPCSRYLYIISRQSEVIEIWDTRATGDVVAVLHDRKAMTNQRIWADITSDGAWLVSGGTDGYVKGWNLNGISGVVQPSSQFRAHEGIRPSLALV